tara:strand:- start:663 stop:1013 length:351 start_codon:yes stop_codon:yes gene_type:complete
MDERMVSAIHDLEGAELEPRVMLAMMFVERWVRDDARSIDETFFTKLLEHFSERELVELAITTGTVELSHKFNTAFAVIPRHDGDTYEVGTPGAPQHMRDHLSSLGIKSPRAKEDD